MRIKSLEDQLGSGERECCVTRSSLDNRLRYPIQINISISKLVDQINESNQYIGHLVGEVRWLFEYGVDTILLALWSREEFERKLVYRFWRIVIYISLLADNMLYKSGSYEINWSCWAETLGKISRICTDYKIMMCLSER